MLFQSAMSAEVAEKVFRSARNGVTRTAALSLQTVARGAPVILATHSASNNGYDATKAAAVGDAGNSLFIGLLHDFPDTTVAKTGAWQGEDTGLVQCYGFSDRALVGTASGAVGAILVPGPTGFVPATVTAEVAVGGLAVLAGTVGTSTGTQTAKVLIRAM